MATFLEICEAFATLPPFKTSASGEVYGSSLPLWHGVNDDALSKLITHSTKEDKDWPVGNFARAVKKQFPHLGDALRREFDKQVLEHPTDSPFMDTKLASLTDAIIGAVTDWSTPEKVGPLQLTNPLIFPGSP